MGTADEPEGPGDYERAYAAILNALGAGDLDGYDRLELVTKFLARTIRVEFPPEREAEALLQALDMTRESLKHFSHPPVGDEEDEASSLH